MLWRSPPSIPWPHFHLHLYVSNMLLGFGVTLDWAPYSPQRLGCMTIVEVCPTTHWFCSQLRDGTRGATLNVSCMSTAGIYYMLIGYATIQWWSVFFLKTNRHHCLESLLPSFTFLWSSQTGMSLSSCLDSWSSLSGRKLSVHTQTTWQTLFIFCLCAWTSFVCYFDTVVSSQSGMGLGWEFYHGHLHWNILPSGLDWPLFTLSLASHACHPRLGWLWGSGTCLPCLVIFCSCTIDAHYTCWLSRIVTFCSALFVSWLSFLSSQTGMTWFSMSDNTIHPSLGWAQHIRASQIYQK